MAGKIRCGKKEPSSSAPDLAIPALRTTLIGCISFAYPTARYGLRLSGVSLIEPLLKLG